MLVAQAHSQCFFDLGIGRKKTIGRYTDQSLAARHFYSDAYALANVAAVHPKALSKRLPKRLAVRNGILDDG